ncbi:MAG: LamG domain-containing protein, partial [Verrucomicrobiota bacterium]|nr:LamG domain-containing protein [Verrucomicrobiota bacterium]
MKYLLIIMVALAIPVHAVDLADGLVAEWTFEEGEGNVVRDTSDNNNNGVLHNEPEWVEDGIGTALRLDGIDDYVDCGTTALIDLTETVSLEAWVKPEKPSTGEPLIAGKSIYAYGLTWTGSSIYFYISDGAWKASTPLPLRQWSHVVGTYDGTRMLLYVNGELASGFVMTEPNTPIKSRGTSAMIGRLAKAYYCGAVDNVRIFSRPLSQKEVKKHYEQEKSKLKQPKLTPIDQLTGLARQVREAGDKSATLTIDSKQQVTADVTVP